MEKSKISKHKTEKHEPLFAKMLQPHFLSSLKRYFSFEEILSKNSEASRSVLIKNITAHKATLPTGRIGFFENLLNTVKPS